MDVDGFWALIGAARLELDPGDPVAAVEEQVEVLRALLQPLGDQELLGFQEKLHEHAAHANDWRVWAAGYLAAGGMSDDSFDYFRLWLVLQGRTAFDQVLADPDRLADLRWDADGEAFDAAEPFGYLVAEVLEDRGSDPGDALVAAVAAGEPTGKPFREYDDAWFARTFPRLSARVGA